MHYTTVVMQILVVILGGQHFTIEHALSCPNMFVRHNELRNITAQLMEEVCLDVGIEPSLQPISNEVLHYKTANTDEGA